MSVKDKLTSIFTLSSLTDASRSIWDIFVVRASVGCLFLAVILSLSGGLQYTTEGLLNIMAEKARLGPAPEGMINSYQCTDNPATEVTALPSVICSDFVVKAVSIEQAATASLHTVNFLLTAYYVFGGLLGNLIYMLWDFGRTMTPKISSFIHKQEETPIEEDVNTLISKLAPLQDDLNANIIPDTSYLSMIFKRTGYGNNNVVYFGTAIDALCAASDYCMKNQVPLHIVDMKRPSLISEEKKEQILYRTQQHDRYCMMFDHDELTKINRKMNIKDPDDCALLDILDHITQYSMIDEKQNILIIQNFHKSQYPKWLYNIIVDITCFNRVCWCNILFINSSFE